jgi:hypothetical protein
MVTIHLRQSAPLRFPYMVMEGKDVHRAPNQLPERLDQQLLRRLAGDAAGTAVDLDHDIDLGVERIW